MPLQLEEHKTDVLKLILPNKPDVKKHFNLLKSHSEKSGFFVSLRLRSSDGERKLRNCYIWTYSPSKLLALRQVVLALFLGEQILKRCDLVLSGLREMMLLRNQQ
jgi:hypothetical protein